MSVATAAEPPPRFELAPGYAISRVVTGCWQLSAGHRPDPVPRDRALAGLLDLAAAGFTTFDGADIYTGVEELFGELRRRAASLSTRPELQLHTKLVPDLEALPDLRRADVEAIVDRSRRRLGVDALDLVQFHWWDFGIPGWIEAAGWLADLRAAGKVRHVGVTNFDAPRLRALLDAGIPVASAQVQYSLVDRRPERALAGLARERGVSLLAYGTLGGGLLAKGRPSGPPANRSEVKYDLMIDEAGGWGAIEPLLATVDDIATAAGASRAEVATAWVLSRPAVGAAIVGVSADPRVESRRRTASIVLPPTALAALDAALATVSSPPGAVYELEREAGGRHAAIMRTDLNREGGA